MSFSFPSKFLETPRRRPPHSPSDAVLRWTAWRGGLSRAPVRHPARYSRGACSDPPPPARPAHLIQTRSDPRLGNSPCKSTEPRRARLWDGVAGCRGGEGKLEPGVRSTPGGLGLSDIISGDHSGPRRTIRPGPRSTNGLRNNCIWCLIGGPIGRPIVVGVYSMESWRPGSSSRRGPASWTILLTPSSGSIRVFQYLRNGLLGGRTTLDAALGAAPPIRRVRGGGVFLRRGTPGSASSAMGSSSLPSRPCESVPSERVGLYPKEQCLRRTR